MAIHTYIPCGLDPQSSPLKRLDPISLVSDAPVGTVAQMSRDTRALILRSSYGSVVICWQTNWVETAAWC